MSKILRQMSWGRAAAFLLILWLVFAIIALGFLRHEPDHLTSKRINHALNDLQALHTQREEITRLLLDYNSGNGLLKQEDKDAILKSIQEKVNFGEGNAANELIPVVGKPSWEYEKLRRRLRMGVEEMWFFISNQLRQIQKRSQVSNPALSTLVNKLLEEGVEHKRSLLSDVNKLKKVDGFEGWRQKEFADLSDLVQRRISYLQNPADCGNARKLVCKLNKGCGYGCQLHHAVYCLITAYGTQRTMILESRGWRYNRGGWEQVFKPVSNTCTEVVGPTHNWPGTHSSQNVLLGIIDSVSPRPPYLPLAVPKDLADRISRLHGDPSVWWVGQFLKYFLRPQDTTSNLLYDAGLKFNFQRPIVGVHIRRTDKVGTEAAFHSVDEYMFHVEEYYKTLSLTETVPKKRIYLASDDFRVFNEIKMKYPDYEVHGDPQIAKSAAVSTRYSDNSLSGIIIDIHFLSQSDYLVCTFSSQVCRVAYEIMQTLHPDYSDRFRSLDDIYYYGGQGMHKQVAIMSHRASSPEQMDLEVGDIIGVAGNHWDGYSKGTNLRSNRKALYPSFKVDEVVETADFPAYTEVPIVVNPGET